jgi:hypothetical protein
MQPYLLPYIGYFQLLAAVDEFIVYDNIQYTKKGWINRNRLLENGRDAVFTLPITSASDYLDVRDRTIATEFKPQAMLQRFASAYGRAPFYAQTKPLLDEVFGHADRNLFGFLEHALHAAAQHLGIDTPIRVSSTVPIDHGLKAEDKVLALCAAAGASTYINSIGGTELYSRERFAADGVELSFLRALPFEYQHKADPFVPSLSIVDVLMHNPLDEVRERLRTGYELI